jgi:hypothetical protein
MPDLVVGHDACKPPAAFDLPPKIQSFFVHGPPSHTRPTL